MSEELKLKLVFDTKDAARAADALPDALERAGRKGRRSWEGTGSGDTATGSAYEKMASAKRDMEAAEEEWNRKELARKLKELRDAEQVRLQNEAATQAWNQRELARKLREIADKEEADRQAYINSLRHNSRMTELAIRLQQAEEQAKRDAYIAQLKWNSRILEEDEKRKLEEYKRQLKWNSKLQEDADKAASSQSDWITEFEKGLEGIMLRTFAPAAAAAKAVELGWGNVIKYVQNWMAIGQAKSTYGIAPAEMQFAESLANVGFASNEEMRDMAARAATQSQAAVSGMAGQNLLGFQYFGMNDHARYREEGFPMTQLLLQMAKRFREEGGSAPYHQAAESILGENWIKLKPLFHAATRGEGMNREKPEKFFERIERNPTLLSRYIQGNYEYYRTLGDKPGDMMGGLKGGTLASMPFVTSLQQMGGGDVLSAITRGPIDTIATASQVTAQNTTVLANQASRNAATTPNPARVGP